MREDFIDIPFEWVGSADIRVCGFAAAIISYCGNIGLCANDNLLSG